MSRRIGRLVLTLAFVSLAPPAIRTCFAAEPDYARAAREGLEHLKAIVRVDTSNPPGNEIRVADYMAGKLREAGVEAQRFEAAPGRGSLVARIRGNGSKRPLLIMAHIDVVPVEASRWSVDPFGAVEKDGYLWGRGTLDDKGMAAAELQVMLELARSHAKLSRDVVFLAEADEETGGANGMDSLLKKQPELFDAELVLNEGGYVFWGPDRKVLYVAVQTTEKIYQDFTITAHGVAGHSSIPSANNPVDHLVLALDRVSKIEFPVEMNDVTRAFFSGIASRLPGEQAACAGKLEENSGKACFEALSKNPNFGAVLRNTCTPTMLKAGYKENVIPAEATGNLNCRLLPGTDLAKLQEMLQRTIGDPDVTVAPAMEFPPPASASSTASPLFEAIRKVAAKMYPGAPVVPYMSPGGTDSQGLRKRGMIAYGLLPSPIQEEELKTMHAKDEKVAVDAFALGQEMLLRVVLETAK
ncbi:MAG TPA: M20/M25/M40 family metallo-hydrolase [Candidatus Polarisedimenticolia bacterium]|nr:M20/M25/M40 family metallo-hydrolase [Candidatus Polarisedimenticolia bacterium]